MSHVRNFATFDADFPDDQVEDEDGENVLVPGGRNVLAAVCAELARRGCEVREPEPHSFYGWEAEFGVPEGRGWMLLQWVEVWLLIVTPRVPWWTFPGRRRVVLGEAVAAVDEALRGLATVRDVRWRTGREFARDEFDRGRRVRDHRGRGASG